MRKLGKSIVTLTIILSPILIMGKPTVGRVENDYYSILGINENSSQDEVLQAFYMLSEKYSNDTTNDPSVQLRWQKIIEAYGVLSDVEKRRQYDYQRRLGGNFQTTGNFGYPNTNTFSGDFPFGPQFNNGNGGNAFAWTSGNTGGAGNSGWTGTNGWGNGFNNNYGWGAGNGMNTAYAWGGQGGGYGGGVGGGGSYGQPTGGGNYAWGTGGDGSAWVVGGGQKGATAWATGGSGGGTGASGNGAAVAVSGGGSGGDASYESYTINGCTTVTQRNGNSVTQYTTCE